MNTQEFENISLDLLMGRLSEAEKEQFLCSLSTAQKAEFIEKERIFNLVKKTGEQEIAPPADLVDRIMNKVREDSKVVNKRGFMEGSLFRKIAAPTALTVTVALALMTSNKTLESSRVGPGKVTSERVQIEAEKPVSGRADYDELVKQVTLDQKITQQEERAEAAQMGRIEKEQKASQEKLTGVISEIVNRIELLDEGLEQVGAKGDSTSLPVLADKNNAIAKDAMGSVGYERDVGALLKTKRELVNSPELPGRIKGEPSYDLSAYPKSQIANFNQAAAPVITDGERYGQFEERAPVLVSSEPVSTFSIDVDTGGYTNIRKLILSGTTPPSSAIRVEEMINYFDYSYPDSDGPEPFSFGYEAAPSPFDVNKVFLKLGIKAKATTAKTEQGWNLVFLVDVSGSMSDSDKLPLLKDSMKVFVEHMRPVDKLSIVTYAGDAGILLEPTSGNQKDKIFNAINTLSSGGSTNGSGGINAAYELAEKNKIPGGVNRVILATDGDFNVGVSSFDGLVSLIEQKRRSGITLTTLGVGRGNYNEQNLEQLADKGNGNYFYLDSVDEASRVLGSKLTSNMEMVAKDVKLQIEFNPAQVVSYRLIGYDNRKLNNQDFKNDAIDAGEIGAGHTVTAIYELVLAGSKAATSMQPDELRYKKVAPTEDKVVVAPSEQAKSELAYLKIRYKAPQEETSKLLEFPLKQERIKSDFSATSDDFRFAASVAGFGQSLRGSRYAGEISLGRVREIATNAIGEDKDGKRKEFLGLVDRIKGLANTHE